MKMQSTITTKLRISDTKSLERSTRTLHFPTAMSETRITRWEITKKKTVDYVSRALLIRLKALGEEHRDTDGNEKLLSTFKTV